MQVKIDSINNYGNGCGIYNNKKVIIPQTCPGDIVDFDIIKENKDFITAKVNKFISLSQNRIDYNKICPIYDLCGGCNLLHLNDTTYYQFKKDIIGKIILKLDNVGIKDFDIIKIGYNTRRRVVFQVKNNKLGFFERNTNNIVEVNSCPLINNNINSIIEPLKNITKKVHHINEISIVSCENGLGVLFILNKDLSNNDNSILLDFAKNNQDIITLSYKINNEEPYLLIQKLIPQLTFDNDIKIDLPVNIFLQATLEGQKEITKIVVENLKDCKKVLDLYCGIGTYTFPLSSYTKVHAVEGSEFMINTMKENILNNKLNNKITTECRNLVEAPLLLNELNRNLALYPNSFFKEINTGNYNLSIYLLKRYSQKNVTGITDSTSQHVIISLATDYSYIESLHHELYHYIEKYMYNRLLPLLLFHHLALEL